MVKSATFQYECLILDEQGEEHHREIKEITGSIESIDTNITLDLISIPSGQFIMGCPQGEIGINSTQLPQHSVTLSSFSISKTPITQAQWAAVAQLPKIKDYLDSDPAHFKNPHHPVEQISWYQAVEFCQRLSTLTGNNYQLPTEAQWEYACRGNTTTPFHFGLTLNTNIANYSGIDWIYNGKVCSKGSYGKGKQGQDRRETTAVGSFAVANAFGLYDCHGNVREWCLDDWYPNYENAPSDGSAWLEEGENSLKVLRGGSWNTAPKLCRSAYRTKSSPETCLYDIGFRVVCRYNYLS